MENTGERYLPEFDADWTLEHTHRYLLARELAGGKAVLDIACGDGYGSRILAEAAKSVVGVDISLEAVERAREKYPHPRLAFLQGSAASIPLEDGSVDLVTSFETIEHLAEQEEMIREIRRVLRPGGMCIISSPDKHEYSDITGYVNEYHVKELYRDEFVGLLKNEFSHMRMHGQRIIFGSLVGTEDENAFLSWRKNEPQSRTAGLANAEYLIALAGDGPLPQLPSSVLKTPQEQSDRVRELSGSLDVARQDLAYFRSWEKEAREYISQLEYQKKILEEQRDSLEKELLGVYCSQSWRITAPLRDGTAWIRRVLRRQEGGSTYRAAFGPPPVWPPDVRALEKPLRPEVAAPRSDTPIGVFLHIYYTDLAGEMLDCLSCLPEPAGVHISTDTAEKQHILADIFAEKGFPHADIRVCPNRGWDIAPFLVGFADAIARYPLILRLHSKRSTFIPGDVGETWRKMLFGALCGSVERVNGIMRAFDGDSSLGMVCPPLLSHYADSLTIGRNFSCMRDLLRPFNVQIKQDTPVDFPMGSMFWCRPSVLAPWLEKNFRYEDFTPTSDGDRDGTLAHALERLFFFGCGITGHGWARVHALPAV